MSRFLPVMLAVSTLLGAAGCAESQDLGGLGPVQPGVGGGGNLGGESSVGGSAAGGLAGTGGVGTGASGAEGGAGGIGGVGASGGSGVQGGSGGQGGSGAQGGSAGQGGAGAQGGSGGQGGQGGAGAQGGSAGQGGAAGSSGSGGSGGAGDPCELDNTCASATDIGSVSGDTSDGVLSLMGTASTWLKVRVTEDDDSLTSRQLSITATLSSPAGDNFDLFAYVNEGSDQLECSAVFASSQSGAGQADSVYVLWGETGLFPNGSSDSRWVTLEVRATSAACTTPWTLTVDGDT